MEGGPFKNVIDKNKLFVVWLDGLTNAKGMTKGTARSDLLLTVFKSMFCWCFICNKLCLTGQLQELAHVAGASLIGL